nr:uncharacterized protein LOC127310323 [Lolium perenne]
MERPWRDLPGGDRHGRRRLGNPATQAAAAALQRAPPLPSRPRSLRRTQWPPPPPPTLALAAPHAVAAAAPSRPRSRCAARSGRRRPLPPPLCSAARSPVLPNLSSRPTARVVHGPGGGAARLELGSLSSAASGGTERRSSASRGRRG